MMPVPRRSKRAAGQEEDTPVNGTAGPELNDFEQDAHDNDSDVDTVDEDFGGADANTDDTNPEVAGPDGVTGNGQTQEIVALATPDSTLPRPSSGPKLVADPGLYAVLRLDPSASDWQIQTTYRRQAARLLSDGANNTHAMRELNAAYEVLGNPVRRAEYDRMRVTQLVSPHQPTPIRPGAKAAAQVTRRRRPRHVVQPRYAGLPDVLVVLMVVGLAVLAGTFIIPRLSINLSALNALQNVLPLVNTPRRVIDATVTPAQATSTPMPTPRPGVAERFAGSTVSVSNPNPPQNTPQNVLVRLRRDGQPAANFEVWALVQYRTTEERWPASGGLKTDASGAATISFNIGSATPNYPVQVRVFAQIDDQQVSWSTSFTPR
jgi:DnaJ domain